MDSKEGNSIAVIDAKSKGKEQAAERDVPPVAVITKKKARVTGGPKKGLAIIDLVLRLGAGAAAFGAAYSTVDSEQVLPFFTQFFQFHAEYSDFPTFQFFLIANIAAVGYVGLSIPLSIVCIIRPRAIGPRLLLVIIDTVMIALLISASGASTAILYLAHNGNVNSNWLAICMQFSAFCQTLSGAVVASLIAAVFFLLMVVNSIFALKK